MMFLVGYISCPPTIGFFIPATADVTAIATIPNTTAISLFIVSILFRVEFFAPRLQYEATPKSDLPGGFQLELKVSMQQETKEDRIYANHLLTRPAVSADADNIAR